MITEKKAKYIEAVGRRKTSVARVRFTPSSKQSIKINGKTLEDYFKVREYQEAVLSPLSEIKLDQKFDISVIAKGGGISSQSEAVRLGVARCMVLYDGETRKVLKKNAHLKRDPRMKERRKFGLKKARKAPQWSKR